jgi:hypothetical protein
MSNIRQIQANQLQSQPPIGPRSPAPVMNVLKSGIDAQALVAPGESLADFAALETGYRERWFPATPEQRALVDMLIADEWLLRRYTRLETLLWRDCAAPPDSAAGLELSQALQKGGPVFDRILRHKNAAQRNFQTALRHLERLKKEQLIAPGPEPEPLNPPPITPPPPQPADSPYTSGANGFVPKIQPTHGAIRAVPVKSSPTPGSFSSAPPRQTPPPDRSRRVCRCARNGPSRKPAPGNRPAAGKDTEIPAIRCAA